MVLNDLPPAPLVLGMLFRGDLPEVLRVPRMPGMIRTPQEIEAEERSASAASLRQTLIGLIRRRMRKRAWTNPSPPARDPAD